MVEAILLKLVTLCFIVIAAIGILAPVIGLVLLIAYIIDAWLDLRR